MPLIAFISPPGSPGADLACRLAAHGLEAEGLATIRSPSGRWGIPFVINMPESLGGVDADPFMAPTFRYVCMNGGRRSEVGGSRSGWPEGAFEIVALQGPMPGCVLPGRVALHVRLHHRAPTDICTGWPIHLPLPTLSLPSLDDAEQASLDAGHPLPHIHELAAHVAKVVLERLGDSRRRAHRLRWPNAERRRLPIRGRTGKGRGR
jgi:hypothetical protein